jgi:pimeloyl-ACP methyl ester carboxylesterase
MARARQRHIVVLTCFSALVLGAGTSAASAGTAAGSGSGAAPEPVPELAWADCGVTDAGTAAGVQCATADLPMDYDAPDGDQVHIAVAKVPATDPAHRIGSLFFNFGGPGGPSVDYLQAAGAGFLATLNERFDLIGFDPRGVGQSSPSIDCKANQETQGIYSLPAPTPLDIDADAYVAKSQSYVDLCLANNGAILEHVSTANVARDMDALRAALGEDQLNYLGFSYGTFLGATYAALFPDHYRALVLDGPVDAEQYINDPMRNIAEQTAGFEVALSRFLEACAVDQTACSGFGGTSPSTAFDHLVAAADVTPIPADGYTADPRPVTGDDIRTATLSMLYAKPVWGELASVLAQAAAGDGSAVRAEVDSYYGLQDDGSYDPLSDRYFVIGATEQKYPQGDLSVYLDRGAESWASFPHFWANSGYAEISYALWPAHDKDAYDGPFTVPASAPTPLVVATTYDPATPYPGARQLVQEMGNARLLTMDGDGHTAYGGNSTCVDGAVEGYLLDQALPQAGTVCQQEVPFAAPEPAPADATSGVGTHSPAAVAARMYAARLR